MVQYPKTTFKDTINSSPLLIAKIKKNRQIFDSDFLYDAGNFENMAELFHLLIFMGHMMQRKDARAAHQVFMCQ